MKAIVCEMCGSQDLVKQDGMYVCQSCGTKYSTDEAKKLMVEVSGSVTVDNTKKLENYYQLARQAKENSNSKDAEKYYDLIRQENPNDWEAAFYAPYFSAMQTNLAGLSSAAYKVSTSSVSALRMLKDSTEDKDKRIIAFSDMGLCVAQIATAMHKSTMSHYYEFSQVGNALGEKIDRIQAISLMLINYGDALEALFPDIEEAKEAAVMMYDLAFKSCSNSKTKFPKDRNTYIAKIKSVKPEYIAPAEKVGSCYVATAVYGSYDCAQVWTLRRYRDYTLAATWYGRAFIRTYYAISPTLVKWFGETAWFKNMWKPKLDSMVARLNADGVEDTPYQDKNW